MQLCLPTYGLSSLTSKVLQGEKLLSGLFIFPIIIIFILYEPFYTSVHSERTTKLNHLLRFIGRKITFFRRIRGISQAELADEVSIEKEVIDAIEKGKEDPSITKLYKISHFLKATIEDFFPKKNVDKDFALIYQQLKRPNQEKVFHFARHLLRDQTKIIDFNNFKNDSSNETNSKTYRIPIQSDFVFLVDDTSMADLIPKGTPVFCRSQPTAKDGDIAVLEVFRLGTICRKISYDFEEGTVTLKPLNPEFTEIEYEHDQVKVIGIVLLR